VTPRGLRTVSRASARRSCPLSMTWKGRYNDVPELGFAKAPSTVFVIEFRTGSHWHAGLRNDSIGLRVIKLRRKNIFMCVVNARGLIIVSAWSCGTTYRHTESLRSLLGTNRLRAIAT
jgi:hypothetical protein